MIIGIISDIHQNSDKDREVLSTTIENIVGHNVTGLLMGGDIGDYHNDRKKAFNLFIEKFPKKYYQNLFLMLGNHDVRTGARPDGSLDPDLVNLYDSYLNTCNIKRDKDSMCIDGWIGGYHFLCLNTDVGLKDKMELNHHSISWLKDKLDEDAIPGKPIFLMTHQSLNSTHWRAGLFGGFGDQDEELKEIFSAYPQLIILNGHIHNGFGVIECIQRPFGTLVEIPSLTRSENGIRKQGTGYLLKIDDERLIFEAWDFYDNRHYPEYNLVIELPTLSVLAKELANYQEGEGQKLLVAADALMNKKYLNDMPSGNSTINSQESYGLAKNYGSETWHRINELRRDFIDFEEKIDFYKLPFKNSEIITEQKISDALDKHNNIEIIMGDGYWSPEIYIPAATKSNQIIKISSFSTFKCTITTVEETYLISRNEEFIFTAKSYFDVKKTK